MKEMYYDGEHLEKGWYEVAESSVKAYLNTGSWTLEEPKKDGSRSRKRTAVQISRNSK